MIANLPAHEKQAFFGLLDEYFASRPHRLPSNSAAGAAKPPPARGVAGLTDRATNAAGAAAGAAASSAASNALRDQFARTGLVKGPPPAAPSSSRKPAFGAAGSRSSSSTQVPTTSNGAAAGAGRTLPPPTRTGASVPAPAAAAAAAPAATTASLPAGAIGSAQVLYDYGDGTDADDLQATEGEHIYLTEKISDDWWRAMSQDQSRTGIIPTTYVRQL